MILDWVFPVSQKMYFFSIMPLMGTTLYSAYLIEPLQLTLYNMVYIMVGVFSWNAVDLILTLTFDPDLKLSIPRSQKM